ncbi:MAG TPA: DUF3160 domain-containing protein [Candidatus Krumholzibacteria bacterium]|nr:DUF3160 domain-containing protein [Candidatus Krumholzibacteria bacterium]
MARLSVLVVLSLFVLCGPATAGDFDLDAYRAHLEQDADLTASALLERHAPVGPYLHRVDDTLGGTAFLDSVITALELRDGELDLLERHGFVVSERLHHSSYGAALRWVWHADLPVFLSSDLFLHTFHRSFDEILKGIELTTLIPTVDGALASMRAAWPDLAAAHAEDTAMQDCVADLDLYLSVALTLLRDETTGPLDPANQALYDTVVAAARDASGLQDVALFNDTPRTVDFSQFVPRGHYTDRPELERYFRCLMWLGRIDFRLSIPPGIGAPPSVQREVVDAFLLRALVDRAGVRPQLERIDDLLRVFIGESDNTTLAHLDAMATELTLSDPAQLWDATTYEAFEDLLDSGAYQPQAINSRVLIGDPMSGEPLDPPYAFLLMGQRFTIDSNVLGNVVYDRIRYQGSTPFRGLPDPLDVLYALGNDDVLPLLEDELETYHYAANLSALRYLIDSYDDTFWSSSLYTHWLAALRTLTGTGEIDGAPDFMRTGGWQQQKMNTQLASWAELRHDTILYVKQSYTGGVICSYPHGYVEPVPALYDRLRRFAEFGRDEIVARLDPGPHSDRIAQYFDRAAALMDTVGTIAQKELDGVAFSAAESSFLQRVLFAESGCNLVESGWLPRLYYCADGCSAPASETDRIIADVHTQPTDEFGSTVGKVLHVATANPLLGVFVARCPGGAPTAFVGPVASYRELVTLDFHRLTDDDWESILDGGDWSNPLSLTYDVPPTESWTHVYLTDTEGRVRTDAASILGPVAVDAPADPGDTPTPARDGVRWVRGQPNPFNPRTVIGFELTGKQPMSVRVEIVDARGARVAVLVDETLQPGTYLIPWRGEDANGRAVASGVYHAKVAAGMRTATTKLTLVR